MDMNKNEEITEEVEKLCNNLKEIFKGGVEILNPENYHSAMARYYRKF